DAARLGFSDGEEVMLASPRNKIKMILKLSLDVRVGNLFTTFHFPEVGVNSVLSSSADYLTKCPEYKVQAVAILPA
nr:formate dehydrogenase subunit alpha [Candidatus Poseidoniales archaeon]